MLWQKLPDIVYHVEIRQDLEHIYLYVLETLQ